MEKFERLHVEQFDQNEQVVDQLIEARLLHAQADMENMELRRQVSQQRGAIDRLKQHLTAMEIDLHSAREAPRPPAAPVRPAPPAKSGGRVEAGAAGGGSGCRRGRGPGRGGRDQRRARAKGSNGAARRAGLRRRRGRGGSGGGGRRARSVWVSQFRV